MGARMVAHPDASLPQQMQGWTELTGAYRLLNHPQVQMNALLAPHQSQTLAQARTQPVVLWVEDTTELDFTAHPHMSGVGPIGDGRGRGLLLHATLGVRPDTRQVLGLGAVQVVLRQARPKQTFHWRRTPEARVWERSAQAIGAPPEGCVWVHVSDSGSDIFEYLATCVAHHKHFLVRVYHNRILTWGQDLPEADQAEAHKLLDYARSLSPHPDSGYTIQVDATKKQPARTAHLALAWAALTIAAPERAPAEVQAYPPVSAWVLRAWEPDPPEGAKAVEWVLITSLPVLVLADAQEKIGWYSLRWLCEDFHQCLKTGCKVEASQLDDGEDVQNLLGFAAPIAVHLLQVRQEVRQAPETLAVEVVDPLMVDLLARLVKNNAQTLSVEQFFLGVARLGGYLGRKSDGPPGWRTLWRGWQYLSDLTCGARLFHDTS
jgi:hypothetical protein